MTKNNEPTTATKTKRTREVTIYDDAKAYSRTEREILAALRRAHEKSNALQAKLDGLRASASPAVLRLVEQEGAGDE